MSLLALISVGSLVQAALGTAEAVMTGKAFQYSGYFFKRCLQSGSSVLSFSYLDAVASIEFVK